MVRSENGTYHWTGTYDEEYETKQYHIVWAVVGITCLFMAIFGGVLCISEDDWSLFPAFLLPCLFILIITFLIITLFRKSKAGYTRGYSMSEHSIWIGSRRSRADFYFHSAKHVIFTKTYIEPVKKIGGFRIYVPEEDMAFVMDFVIKHLPADCEIDERMY